MFLDRSDFPALSAESFVAEYYPLSPAAPPELRAECLALSGMSPSARRLNAQYLEAQLLSSCNVELLKAELLAAE